MESHISAWPTEALIALFSVIDPLVIREYSTVCRRWAQICADNELWHRYCTTRWANNPKEADCAKNWLIPTREGVAQKGNRIDWKMAYLLRDLAHKSKRASNVIAPQEKSKLGKARNAIKNNLARKDYFGAKGWITPSDLFAFQDDIFKALATLIKAHDNTALPHEFTDSIWHLLNFHLEFQMQILRQVNISRTKYLLFAGNFISEASNVLTTMLEYTFGTKKDFATRILEALRTWVAMAMQKDLPRDIVDEYFFPSVTNTFCAMITEYPQRPLEFYKLTPHLLETIMVACLYYPYDADEWLKGTELSEDDNENDSPFRELQHFITLICSCYPNDNVYSTIWAICQTILDNKMKDLPDSQSAGFIAALTAMWSECGQWTQDVQVVFDKYLRPFFNRKSETAIFLPLLHDIGDLISGLEGSLQQVCAPQIMELIDAASEIQNDRVANYIIGIVASLFSDESFRLSEADVSKCLQKLYASLASSHPLLRENALKGICNVMLSIPEDNFNVHKVSFMEAIGKFLADCKAEERQSVADTLARLIAKNNSWQESIGELLITLFDQIVEQFKNDIEGQLDVVLSITNFVVRALQNKFAKYLPVLMPTLVQRAVMLDLPEDEMEDETAAKALICLGGIFLNVDYMYTKPHSQLLPDVLQFHMTTQGLPFATEAAELFHAIIVDLIEKDSNNESHFNEAVELFTFMLPKIGSAIQLTDDPTAKDDLAEILGSVLNDMFVANPAFLDALMVQSIIEVLQDIFIPNESYTNEFAKHILDIYITLCRTTVEDMVQYAKPFINKLAQVTSPLNPHVDIAVRWLQNCVVLGSLDKYSWSPTAVEYLLPMLDNVRTNYIFAFSNSSPELLKSSFVCERLVATKFPDHLPKNFSRETDYKGLVDFCCHHLAQKDSFRDLYNLALVTFGRVLKVMLHDEKFNDETFKKNVTLTFFSFYPPIVMNAEGLEAAELLFVWTKFPVIQKYAENDAKFDAAKSEALTRAITYRATLFDATN